MERQVSMTRPVRRLAGLCLISMAAIAGSKAGYRYGAAGALVEVRDVTSDPGNCGAIGAACAAGQVCCFGSCCAGTCTAANQCCAIPVCAGWQACGDARNSCGNTTACGSCAMGQRCATDANQCFLDRTEGYVVRAENASNQLVAVAGHAPEVVKAFPGMFNSNWQAFWNIE
jgi:hypothetical protein